MPINHTPIQEAEEKEKTRKEKEPSFYELNPQYCFSDIILPEEVEENVKESISYIKNHNLIFDVWNLKSVIKHYNLCINLYGPSGTGKTMTAHAIANELGKKLIVVNYAEIESKYVGETAKNLVNLFKYAQKSDQIILFDEADALLSKRVIAMNSATDVSVNQTRNTLLKLLDEYEGIIIFTTNFIQNFDIAFLRRIFSNIEFTLPDFAARIKLWEHYLLPTIPIENRNAVIEQMAKAEDLSGSDIATIVLKAAVTIVDDRNKKIGTKLLSDIAEKIKKARSDVQGGFEITSRKVTEEYVKEHLGKEKL